MSSPAGPFAVHCCAPLSPVAGRADGTALVGAGCEAFIAFETGAAFAFRLVAAVESSASPAKDEPRLAISTPIRTKSSDSLELGIDTSFAMTRGSVSSSHETRVRAGRFRTPLLSRTARASQPVTESTEGSHLPRRWHFRAEHFAAPAHLHPATSFTAAQTRRRRLRSGRTWSADIVGRANGTRVTALIRANQRSERPPGWLR
jgi:hypothetical protein